MDKKKRLKKIESLEKQIEKHKQKINIYTGKDYALLDYWKKEIERFEAEIKYERKEE